MEKNEVSIPYSPRRTRAQGVRQIAGCHLKVYCISVGDQAISNEVVTAALDFSAGNVPWPSHRPEPCYGFLTLHSGTEAVWLLVDLWIDDIMSHFLFKSPIEDPTRFGPGPGDGTTACVWELEVIKYECDAWVKHVLSTPGKPDFESYLNDCLEIL